jgi:PII-like signaling protein
MKTDNNSILKIYASSTDRIGSKIFYDYIVHEAKNYGIAGVTVYRGIMGYGSSSKISSSRFWELTEKLPVTIEMIDETEKVELFFQHIEPKLMAMQKGCLATLEPVKIKLIKSGKKT